MQTSSRARSDSLSSASSGSSSTLAYAEETSTVRTTRQKIDRRPASTWWAKPKSSMSYAELFCSLAATPESMHELKPETLDRGPMPTQSVARENLFIVTRSAAPFLLQSLSYWLFPGEFRESSENLADFPRLQMARRAGVPRLPRLVHRICAMHGPTHDTVLH